jgi:hypothetical protein
MDKKRSDQSWEQLQAHIERFLRQTLRNDVQAAIEYKPRFNPLSLEYSSRSLQDSRKIQTQ